MLQTTVPRSKKIVQVFRKKEKKQKKNDRKEEEGKERLSEIWKIKRGRA